MLKKAIIYCILFSWIATSFAKSNSNLSYKFIANKGQWPQNILYKSDIYSGSVFFEKNAMTYVFYNPSKLEDIHNEFSPSNEIQENNKIHCHAYRMHFLESAKEIETSGIKKQVEYNNYFVGAEQKRWTSNVEVYGGVYYSKIYRSIDLNIYSNNGQLKYDFILHPFSDFRDIKLFYEGVNSISLRDGNLIIGTSVNEVIEQKPFAYQNIDGKIINVSCKYLLKNNIVTFEIASYDKSIPLIIDPAVIASTFAGSTSQAYAGSATFDGQGNIYTAGASWGMGYPITLGAFDITFNGAHDICISKYDSLASSLIFSTYLGGDSADFPQGIYADSNNEIYVFGTTRSPDFPTSIGCYDNSFNGGKYDIILTHFNSYGSTLIGSTYIGGSNTESNYDPTIVGNSGVNIYGEMLVDTNGEIYVASTTKSSDFPITPGALSYLSGEEAIVFEMNNDCSNLLWSTYIGGSGDDKAYGIKKAPNGDIVIAGATTSTDFPITAGSYRATYQGGASDGFICKFHNGTHSLISSTFYGSQTTDKATHLAIDSSGYVYIIGQTVGQIPITSGCFGIPNSRIFIAKFNPSLTTLIFQTMIGNGPTSSNFVPTAFGIDDCDNIYFCGFNPDSPRAFSGYPATIDALYEHTNDDDFYMAVLSSGAANLKFGSYFPGTHAHSGASKFDNNGILYLAICGRAGDYRLPVDSNSYHQSLPLMGNDFYVAKIDFQSTSAYAVATISSSDTICQNISALFSSEHSRGRRFIWNFNDGSAIDTSRNPNHAFSDTGHFNVQMIVVDSSFCIISDTSYLDIYVVPSLTNSSTVDTIICDNPNIVLNAKPSCTTCTFLWSNNQNGDSISVNSEGVYYVRISNGFCNVTDTFRVEKLLPPNLGPDTSLCEGQILNLNPQSSSNSILWSTGDTISFISVSQGQIYWVDFTKQDCTLRDSIAISYNSYPIIDLGNDTIICPGEEASLTLQTHNPSSSKLWSTGDTTESINVTVNDFYWVNVRNGTCSSSDTVRIEFIPSIVFLQGSYSFCSVEEAWLDAMVNQSTYLWSTGETSQKIHVSKPGEYWYQISHDRCYESDTITVSEIKQSELWVPSSFTPNGDGRNEIFSAVGMDILDYKMEVFNRWGKQIFSTNNLSIGWDGKYNGKLMPPGVYSYILEFTTSCSNYLNKKSGFVLLFE